MQIDSQRMIKWLNGKVEELEREKEKFDCDSEDYVWRCIQIDTYKEVISYLRFCDVISTRDDYILNLPPIRPPEQPKYSNTYTSSKGTGKRWDDE